MILTALTVLLPVFFVLLLGYFAGRTKKFDADQVAGLNDLVLDYALPAMMFVATVKTPREQLLSEGPCPRLACRLYWAVPCGSARQHAVFASLSGRCVATGESR